MDNCPCGSLRPYAECCEVYIATLKQPETPETLMRSRYSAYAKGKMDYIADTMTGPAAKDFNKEQAQLSTAQIKWLSLKVIESHEKEERGTVAFLAKFELLGNQETIYEISEFRKENGKWFYFDGATPKIGRNDSCPCGTEKKYKKCCGA